MAWQALVCVCGLALGSPAMAVADAPTKFDIAAQPLTAALKAYAAQANVQLLYASDAVGALPGNAVIGDFDKRDALARLLQGTGLEAVYSGDSRVTIRPLRLPSGAAAPDLQTPSIEVERSGAMSADAERKRSFWNRFRLAQASPTSSDAGSSTAGSPAATPDSGDTLEEIVVTARFKAESAQKIGAAISPLSAETIEREGITDFEDIARRTPGLASTDRGPNTNEVLLRGISNQTTERVTDITAVGPLVSQFLDDVPFASATASQRDVNLFDFARVEVLRGPQPTFFGEGSVGGTIRYISADPNLSGDALAHPVVRLGLSSTQDGGWNRAANAATTFNIVPGVFGVRAVLNWREDDGFIDNPTRGTKDTNTFDSKGARIVALYRPNDALTIRFAGHLSRDDTGDLTFVDTDTKPSDLVLSTPVKGTSSDDVDLYSLKGDYVAGPITWTSITGYYRRKRETTGYDPANSGFFQGLFGTPINILIDNPLRDRTWTQEFRAVSAFDGPFNFTSGLFYKNKDSTVIAALTSPDGTFAPFQAVPGDVIFRGTTTYKTEQYSGFLEGTYAVAEHVRLIGGARYVHETIDSDVIEYLSIGGITPPIPTIDFADFLPASGLPTTYSFKLSKVLPRVAVEVDLTNQALLYASASAGVRNGNLNTAVSAFQAAGGGTAGFNPDTFADLLVFKDDQVRTYELGLKTRSAQNRWTANLAAYFTQYGDPQIYTATPFVLVANGPDAHIKGLELETALRANAVFSLFANASFTDAKYVDSALLIPTLAPAVTADVVDGNRLANVPKWAYSLGINARYPMARAIWVGHLGYQYVGSRNSTAQNFASTELHSLGLLNARLGIETAHWSLVGYIANATNQIEAQSINATGGAAFVDAQGRLDAPVNAVSVNRPRTLGLELTARF